jgi:hypothetical protein
MQYLPANTSVLEQGGPAHSVSEQTSSRVNDGVGGRFGFTGLSAGLYDVQYSDSPTTQICGSIPGGSTGTHTPGTTLALAAEASISNGIYNVHYSDHRTSGANRSLAVNATAADGIAGSINHLRSSGC